MDSVQGAHALAPGRGELESVAAAHVEAGAARVVRADLEPRGVDDAVNLVLGARDDEALLRDALDALPVGVDQQATGMVEGLEVLVVKARPLA